MADPEAVATETGLMQLIDELRRDVDELKGTNRLWGAAPEGQSIHVYTADGVLLGTLGGGTTATQGGLIVRSQVVPGGGGAPAAIAQIGRATVSGYSGEDAVQVGPSTSTAHQLWTRTEGTLLPAEHVAWGRFHDANDSISVVSGSFTATWLCRPLNCPTLHVKFMVTIDCPGGTTGVLRLNHAGGNVSAQSSFSGNGLKTLTWTPGLSIGSEAQLYLEVARTGGAGTILVHRPYPMAFGNWKASAGAAGNNGGVWT